MKPLLLLKAAAISAGLALFLTATSAVAGPLLNNGDTVVASFTSGNLKGQSFRLKFNESKNKLKDRPVTAHTKGSISIKTPGGQCTFHAAGNVSCHNGNGTWKKR